MKSRIERFFGPEDQERIRAAVNAAEGRTSGEIVPYVVEESDSYEGALWKGAALGALGAAFLTGLAQQLLDIWIDPVVAPAVTRWAIPPLAGAALGYGLAGFVAPVRRWLIGASVMERRVRRRASVAFLEEEVFRTDKRTGVLIFLSLFEHRVVVLGDEGINRKVETSEWEGIVDRMVRGIRERKAGEALVEAIETCGLLLERRGVRVRPDDENELSDELRSRER